MIRKAFKRVLKPYSLAAYRRPVFWCLHVCVRTVDSHRHLAAMSRRSSTVMPAWYQSCMVQAIVFMLSLLIILGALNAERAMHAGDSA
jgi:hypothetical protein